jgi:hypothetical protein
VCVKRKLFLALYYEMSKIKINYDPTETLSHDEWPEE